MNQSFVLKPVPGGAVALRTIFEADCERLRQWKNANRFSFFFQEIITPEMQSEWYRKYLERADDYMFMAMYHGQAIGCMGFRMLDGFVDIYNVILGQDDMGGKGLMGKALQLMCSYIFKNFSREIGLKVLRTNPAADWYRANGFVETAARDTYFELTLDATRFQPCPFQRVDIPARDRGICRLNSEQRSPQ